MAVSVIYGIPQIIAFKRYIMCGLWVYCYRFTNYVFFSTGVKGLNDLSSSWKYSRQVYITLSKLQ